MAIRVLHTADWHIGSFPGPEINGENGRFLDVQEILNQFVTAAEREDPDFILIAGDVFHQAKVWSDRGLKEQALCVNTLRKLADIAPVLVMRGTPNHDSEEQFRTLETALAGNDRISIVTRPGIDFYTGKSGQFLQVACIPGFDKALFDAVNDTAENDSVFYSRELVKLVQEMSQQVNPRVPSILAAHYTIGGANMESGQTALFSEVDPTFAQDTLQQSPFSLCCFGHIHKPQRVGSGKPVYYSGALMQLNFNDEGQERGFWIHDIDGAQVQSRFVQLEGREFQTIMLTDGQIASINDKNLQLSSYPGLRGKIVRVRYSCTDVNNKLFNHADAQAALRAAGAFYVSEISPIKVMNTLSGLSMTEESTPESNLDDYLHSKNMDDADIQRLLQLAAPLFTEVNALTHHGTHAGVLLPLEIAVENYRNYAKECFDFSNIQFCTINGENGAGKSSLFMDAICDALYEEPREGDLTGWIRNDPKAKSGMIRFTFSLGDEVFRVTRRRAKAGKITLDLEQKSADGSWDSLSCSKTKDTQARIEELVGMDSLTFRACALIMQDQYGLFLEADKEARMDILGSILGLGIYDDLETMAANKIVDINRQARDLAAQENVLRAGLDNLDMLDGELNLLQTQSKDIQSQLSGLRMQSAQLVSQEQSMQAALKRAEQTQVWLTERLTDRQAQQDMLSEQNGKIQQADALIAQESEILQGVLTYQEHQQKLTAMQTVRSANQVKLQRLQQVKDEQASAEAELQSRMNRRDVLQSQLDDLRLALAKEPELQVQYAKYEDANRRVTELTGEKDAAQTTAGNLQAELVTAQKAVGTAERKKAKKETEFLALQKRVRLLSDCNCLDIEKAECSFLADAKKAQQMLPETEAELSVLDKQVQDCVARVSELETRITQQKICVDKLDNALMSAKREMAACESDAVLYRALAGKKEQLTLQEKSFSELEQDIAASQSRLRKLADELSALVAETKDIDAFEAEYQALDELVQKAHVWVDKQSELVLAKQSREQAVSLVKTIQDKLSDMDKAILDMKTKIQEDQQAAAGLAQVQQSLAQVNQQIDEQDKRVQAIALDIGRLKEKREDANKKLAECDALLKAQKDLKLVALDYDTLKKAFSTDGIRHNIIRSIIPVLEASSTAILSQMSAGRMSVEFKTEKTLKSNKNKEVTTLDIIVHDTITGSLPYMSRSGGEKVKVSLSVILALAEIRSRKSGVSLGFLFIDEPPFLDGMGGQAYCDALEAVQSRYSNLKIMAITHDISMKSRFPQSITVVKTPNGSRIERY